MNQPTPVQEPDYDALMENNWDNYLAECETEKLRPSLKSFKIWLEDRNIDYEDD